MQTGKEWSPPDVWEVYPHNKSEEEKHIVLPIIQNGLTVKSKSFLTLIFHGSAGSNIREGRTTLVYFWTPCLTHGDGL